MNTQPINWSTSNDPHTHAEHMQVLAQLRAQRDTVQAALDRETAERAARQED